MEMEPFFPYHGTIYLILGLLSLCNNPRVLAEEVIVMFMSRAVFVFFLVMGLILLYLTVLIEYQLVVAGVCRP
jgi:hypothetical protein